MYDMGSGLRKCTFGRWLDSNKKSNTIMDHLTYN